MTNNPYVNFTVCNTVTRKVLRQGKCRQSMVAIQAQAGEEVFITPEIPDDEIVQITPEGQVEVVQAFVEEKRQRLNQARLKANKARIKAALSASDFTQLPDAKLTAEEKQAWKDYRKSLRDLQATADELILPTPPEEL